MNKIKVARLLKDMTQAQVAAAAGVHQQNYSLIERGKTCPKVSTAKRLAAVLGIDWKDFYEDAESEMVEHPAPQKDAT